MNITSDQAPRLAPPTVGPLISAYLGVLDLTKHEPIFSPMSFLRFYGIYFWWALNLSLLPLVALLNLGIFVARITTRRFASLSYIGSPFLRLSKRAALSLQAGEIPALKFFVLRSIVAIFSVYHMRNRCTTLLRHLQRQLVRSSLAGNRADLDALAEQVRETRALRASLPENALFKILLAISPAAGIVIKAMNMLGINVELPSDWSTNARGYIFRTLGVAAYLLWAIVSCFIRKRELFLMNGVYDQENRLRAQLGELGREFPLDLIGWIAVLGLAVGPLLFEGVLQRPPAVGLRPVTAPTGPMLATYGIYILPLLYALMRRFWRGQR